MKTDNEAREDHEAREAVDLVCGWCKKPFTIHVPPGTTPTQKWCSRTHATEARRLMRKAEGMGMSFEEAREEGLAEARRLEEAAMKNAVVRAFHEKTKDERAELRRVRQANRPDQMEHETDTGESELQRRQRVHNLALSRAVYLQILAEKGPKAAWEWNQDGCPWPMKAVYPTRGAAWRVIHRHADDPTRQRPYWCEACRAWHIGGKSN